MAKRNRASKDKPPIDRPKRLKMSRAQVLKRMAEFRKRKKKFVAAIRKGSS